MFKMSYIKKEVCLEDFTNKLAEKGITTVFQFDQRLKELMDKGLIPKKSKLYGYTFFSKRKKREEKRKELINIIDLL